MTIARELAHRQQDGLEVTLLWDALSNEVSIQLVDDRSESTLTFQVDAVAALEAFYHPYVYAPAPPPESLEERAVAV